RRLLRCYGRCLASGRHEYVYAPLHKFGSERRQPAVLAASPAVFDGHVLAVEKAGFSQSFEKRLQYRPSIVGGAGTQEPDHRPRCLLCARSKWPRRYCTTDKTYELTSPHRRPRGWTRNGSKLRHRSGGVDVRLGSKADICTAPAHVRFCADAFGE